MAGVDPADRVRRAGRPTLVALVTAAIVVTVLAGSQVATEVAAVEPTPSPAPSSSALSPLPLPLPTGDATPVPTPLPPAQPSPSATAAASPIPTSGVPVPAPTTAVQPDQVDRAWPRRPPWDACPRPVWPGELSVGAPGNGRRVLVVGDSLTRESRSATARAMRASGWTPTFRCWGSKRLDWGIAQIRRAKELDQLPRFVILALGTNDISWETPATTEARVRTLLRALGPRRQVLWVDLDVDHSTFSRSRALWFNDMIRRVAADRPNLTVVPWRRIARAERADRYDGIHYGSSGYRLRARTVAAALDEVARERAEPR